MRLQVYLLTFSGMALLYTLRAGYSYAKPYLQKQYNMSNLFISLVDAFQFIGLGLAFMFRYFFFSHKYTIAELNKNGMLMCIFFSALPLIPLLHNNVSSFINSVFYGILLICSFLFGFLQYCFQPTLTQEMRKFYTNDEDEMMFSCWDSGKHLGRIMGFILMEIQIINFGFSWETSMLVLIIFMMIDIGLIFYYCDIKEDQMLRQSHRENRIPQPDNVGITSTQFFAYSKECVLDPTRRYYILLTCCYKALSYNFIYWLSTFMFSQNYPQLAGKISLVFVIPIYCGNFLIGKLYEHSADKQQNFLYSNIFLITTTIIAAGGFVFLTLPSVSNYIQFVIVIMIEGFILGGSYNILKINQDLCGYFDKREKEMFVTFVSGSVYFSAGIMAFAIGVTMNIRSSQKSANPALGIFEVMKYVSILALLCLFLWIMAIYEDMENQRQEFSIDFQLQHRVSLRII